MPWLRDMSVCKGANWDRNISHLKLHDIGCYYLFQQSDYVGFRLARCSMVMHRLTELTDDNDVDPATKTNL